MNILIYSLIISIIIYLLLRFIANVSAKKLTRGVRFSIFIISIILALLLAVGGRFLLSFPLVLLSLVLVKLKGLSLFQLLALFRLIQTLRGSGRFTFDQNKNIKNSSILSLEESYKILNLDINKKNSKEEVNKAYIKIQKKYILIFLQKQQGYRQ